MDSVSQDPQVDVAIVGCGPVGAVAANFLGMAGLRCAVLEREPGAHGQPRSFSCDDEALRIYQQIGLVDELRSEMIVAGQVDFTGVHGRTFAEIEFADLDFGSGYSPLHFFHQPKLEAALRAGLRRYPGVALRLGCEVTGLRQTGEGVTLELRDEAGRSRLSARYVLGCDGARSTVRRLLNIGMQGARYEQPWLAVSGHAPEAAIRVRHTTFVCDPVRPAFVGLGPAGEVRIELMALPGEETAALERPGRVRELIAPFVDPDRYRITRAATYRFGQHVADRWQQGRVFLLGDAAHQMPPFMGQGLVSGLRDVANLAWKLALVIRGAADPGILASYELERRAHTLAMIEVSVRMGYVFLSHNGTSARLRDALMRAIQRLERVRRFVRGFEFKPPPLIDRGLIAGGARRSCEAQGTYFPQVRAAGPDGEAMSDRWLGPGFAAVGADVDPRAADRDGLLRRLGARFVRIVGRARPAEPGVVDVVDATGRIFNWFVRHRVGVAIVRPDRYVFGAAPGDRTVGVVRELGRALGAA